MFTFFVFLLCYVCNASLQHLRASILEPREPSVQSLDLYERCLQQDSDPFRFAGRGSGGKSDGIICAKHDECYSGRCQCFKSGSRRCGQCPATMPSNGDRCRWANQVCQYGPQLCCTCPPGGACAPDSPLQNTAVCNGINWEVTSLVMDCEDCPAEAAAANSTGSVGALAPTDDSLVQVASTASIISCSGKDCGCCNPLKEPGKFGNANNCPWSSYVCCLTGEWSCTDFGGDSATCGGVNTNGPFGQKCYDAKCCNPLKEPGLYGNAACPWDSHVCCVTGEWGCSYFGGDSFNCGGVETTGPYSAPCPFPLILGASVLKTPSLVQVGVTDAVESHESTPAGSEAAPTGVTDVVESHESTPAGSEAAPTGATASLVQVASPPKCCNPLKKPNCPVAGFVCCPLTGEWGCSLPFPAGTAFCGGVVTSGPFGEACPAKCCDPLKEPGKFGNANNCPWFGYECCVTGEWSCTILGDNDVDVLATCGGVVTKGPFGSPCYDAKCCDPLKEPGLFGNKACWFSHVCCVTGEWSCSFFGGLANCGGVQTTGPYSASCPLSDIFGTFGDGDPTKVPSLIQVGVTDVVESHESTPAGSEAAPAGTTASLVQVASPPKCCDPLKKPNCPVAGFVCCPLTGEWGCSLPFPAGTALCGGVVTSGPFGEACPAKCCDPLKEPGKFGNANNCPWLSYECCVTGEWSCTNFDHDAVVATCGGVVTKGPFGSPCYDAKCCNPLKEPGLYGNKACPWNYHCCVTGEWGCSYLFSDSTNCGGVNTTGPYSAPCPLSDIFGPILGGGGPTKVPSLIQVGVTDAVESHESTPAGSETAPAG